MKRGPGLAPFGVMIALAVAGCGGPAGDATPDPPRATTDGSAEPDGQAMPPWPAPTDVAARVASAGLDLGPMGMAEHYHPHLRIVVRGARVPVSANIGVDPVTGAMSALHTHEGDGTIHIEADSVGEVFTLGQLFTQWGVTLTPRQIGGVEASGTRPVTVTSNGVPVSGDPGDLRLEPEQRIVLRLP